METDGGVTDADGPNTSKLATAAQVAQLWCEPEHLLASVFPFSHRACCQDQTKSTIHALCNLLLCFLGGTDDGAEVRCVVR